MKTTLCICYFGDIIYKFAIQIDNVLIEWFVLFLRITSKVYTP